MKLSDYIYYQEKSDGFLHDTNVIYCGDCLELLPLIRSSSIDLVLTDPAYESLEKWRKMETTTRLGGHKDKNKQDDSKWFPIFSNDNLPDLVQECHRILKNERHTYYFCDFETLKLLHNFAITEEVFVSAGYGGLYESCKPLIWDKVAPGMGYTYRATYEFILMLWKGKKRKLNDLSIPDILKFKRVAPSQRVYPTQKPLELCELLVSQSTQPNEVIFDPQMGSGTSLVAAKKLGRQFIGTDIDERACEKTKKRLQSI
jgi:site-specific DNA-methyltransferase (adenine-specific)